MRRSSLHSSSPIPGPAATRVQTEPHPSGSRAEPEQSRDWGARLHLRYRPELFDQDWVLSVRGSQIDQLATVGQPLGTASGFGLFDGRSAELSGAGIRAELDQLLDQEGVLGIRANVRRRTPGCEEAVERHGTACPKTSPPTARSTDALADPFNRPGYERQTTWGASLNGTAEIDNFAEKHLVVRQVRPRASRHLDYAVHNLRIRQRRRRLAVLAGVQRAVRLKTCRSLFEPAAT